MPLSSRWTMPGRSTPPMPGQFPATMMQQRVDERVFLVSRAGMHDHPRRFVQHDQVVVLEQNVERDFLGLRFERTRRRDFHRTRSPARTV